jgi:CBS domain containing-hemolysin-like protein
MDVPLLAQLYPSLILFFISLFVRAIFAFIETSITALRLFKLKELALIVGKRYETLFQALEQNPHRVLITTLMVSSFSDVLCAALATNITETIFEHFNLSSGLGFSLGVGIAGIMIILFGEILPKNLARIRGERFFTSVIWIINAFYYLLYPLVTLLIRISDSVLFRSGKKDQEGAAQWVSSEREVRFLIDYIHAQGILEKEKTEMLRNIFDLGRIPVKDIMVPASDVVSIDIETPIANVLEIFSEHQFTRLPVYEHKPDNIIGMVHQKDIFVMLSHKQDKPLKELVRPILFVPESLKINQLLQEFRTQQMHIAIVLNEHGIVTGLITLEDVLEEIVGEISDEHEPSSEKILALQQGGWLVDASIPLEDLSETLNITFETESSITLGGFLTEKLQHLPKKGERLHYKNLYFQIQKASPKRVKQVLIFKEKKKSFDTK